MSLLATTIKHSAPYLTRRITQSVTTRAMHVRSIPMWEGTGNNYAYLVSDSSTQKAVIIDPANPHDVLPVLSPLVRQGLDITNIINTHHHKDHAGGNGLVREMFNMSIIGGKDCPGAKTPEHNSTFYIGTLKFTALHTPCHTQDSICYFVEDGEDRAVFTGDTLFIGGCGRFFEGTPEQMHIALNETLASLPDDTRVYPGHEYTKGNVKFAKTILNNDAIQRLDDFSQEHKETRGKFTIGDEKQHNVFMRVHDPEVQKATGKTNPIEVMGALRSMKDAS